MQNHQSLEDELHVTCGKIPRDDHRTICGLCGCKNSTIDTSKLDLSGHQAVNQVRFGKDSLKDSDYQAALGMLPEDIVTILYKNAAVVEFPLLTRSFSNVLMS